MNLLARQQALLEALRGAGSPQGIAALAGVELARGMQAYRHNAQALAAKALGAVFAGVKAELGDESFEAMAWAFWRACPPERGDLAQWGGELPRFLAAQPGMDAALCELAGLEWARHRAERAADVELDVASLALLGETAPEHLRLLLRPGLALSGRVLVWRKGWRAEHRELSEAEAVFMQALLDGLDLETALVQAAALDFSAWLQDALREGWLWRASKEEHP